MKVNEFEKDLIDSLRSIEDLKNLNAHHFGDKYVDEKLRNYGKSLFTIIKMYLKI